MYYSSCRDMKTRAWESHCDSEFILSEKIIVCIQYKVIKPSLEMVNLGSGSCKSVEEDYP